MKWIVIAMMSLVASSVFAQMPSAEALKDKANAAIDAGAQQTQKAETKTAQTVEAAKVAAKKVEEKALVNLNTAKAEDLAKLPGIGPVRAQAIIDARPYNSIADLAKVKGIKEGVIAKIKNLVTLK